MKQKLILSALHASFAIVLSGFDAGAMAMPITSTINANDAAVYTDYVDPYGVKSSQGYANSFDMSGALGGYTAVSGTVTATFAAPKTSNWYWPASTDTTPYAFSGAGIDERFRYVSYYERSITRQFLDAIETANLGVGKSSVVASSSYYETTTKTGSLSANTVASADGRQVDYYLDNLFDRVTGYGGSFILTLALDPFALASLNTDRMLGFNIASEIGGFYVKDISLSVDTVMAAVPEPETWAMTLAGLGLLGVARRRSPRTAVKRPA